MRAAQVPTTVHNLLMDYWTDLTTYAQTTQLPVWSQQIADNLASGGKAELTADVDNVFAPVLKAALPIANDVLTAVTPQMETQLGQCKQLYDATYSLVQNRFCKDGIPAKAAPGASTNLDRPVWFAPASRPSHGD